MELVVKNFKELSKFEDIVSPVLLSEDIVYTNDTKTLDGEIGLYNNGSQIKVHVTNSKSNINNSKLDKYDGFTKGNKFTKDSPDLSNENNDKPEDTGYSVDFTEQLKKLFAKDFDIELSELDDSNTNYPDLTTKLSDKEYQKFIKEFICSMFNIDYSELDDEDNQ